MQTAEPLQLDRYTTDVQSHLISIEAGAQMTARHAMMMTQRPGFETKAEDELDRAEAVLKAALAKITEAKATYASKPQERMS